MSVQAVSLAEKIKQDVCRRLFGKPVVQNNFRGEVVEQIVARALDESWRHCSEGWWAWDFERKYGEKIRIQVKQTAALQSWDLDPEYEKIERKTGAYFRVAKTGSYYPVEGTSPIKLRWEAAPARHSEIYLFAAHEIDDVSANHFDPGQWKFYLVEADELGERNSISIVEIKSRSEALEFAQLKDAVNSLADKLKRKPRPSTSTPPSPPATS